MIKLLFIVSIVYVVNAETSEDSNSKVLVYNSELLSETLSQKKDLLVLFYAEWCGRCIEFFPIYLEIAEALKDDNLVIAKIDAVAHKELADKHEVTGFPTIKFFKNDEIFQYKSVRKADLIVKWVKKMKYYAVQPLFSIDAVEEFKSTAEVVVVLIGFEEADVFHGLSKTLYEIEFGQCSLKECNDHYKVENGTVILFKTFDEKRSDLVKGFDAEVLKRFIEMNLHPYLMHYNKKSSTLIFEKRFPGLFLFYDKSSEKTTRLESILAQVAPELKEKVQVVLSGIDKPHEKKLAEFSNIQEKDLPVVLLCDTRDDFKRFKLNNLVSPETLLGFVSDWYNNKLSPLIKSEDIPENQEEDEYVLVGNTFDDVVFDKSKDVLVLFYTPYCGHCTEVAPIYKALAENLRHNSNLIIAKFNTDLNDNFSVTLKGYPGIVLWTVRNKAEPIHFSGERTLANFIDFLKTNASLSFTEKEANQDL